ncbi:Trehalose/maltose import ATP-binding protein MalK [Candidatus Lokiarchaeum ossiferum]|uniref:Trehalose/maltose import ATP-binding protein MalK n=1 Tax=Candidatus Lokiarchaeum ossiferum TaxID=2951803 RepID=A0ABY6HQ13_9ARCH|nr:Trehalose/maltose import ATP-binding protein MalK [Candidatus Lokiarchaeum sp. B-35]
MSESNIMLKVEHISKSFENVHAVNDLSFNIKKGEIYGLLGPNGAGKTTTIKMILGLLEPNEGNIDVLGLHPERDEVELKNRIGYVSEEPLIYKSLTPKELFNFIASIRKLQGERVSEKLAQYLDSLGAVEYYERLISTLSRGNKQKIQIIAAILHDPELLIMDEPLAGLDAKSVKVVKEILELHTQRGGSVLFSTHIMEVAEDLCDRIGIVNQGKLVADGTIDELREKAQKLGPDYDLEDIFLKLTDQDESVNEIIEKLRATMNGNHK